MNQPNPTNESSKSCGHNLRTGRACEIAAKPTRSYKCIVVIMANRRKLRRELTSAQF